MAVFRVNKNKNYTVMSNYHFKDKNLSLKAKGLLSQMLSLPEDWDYTVAGLCAINKEKESSVKSALNELKELGYLKVTKLMPNQTKSGRIEYVYDIYEIPTQQCENQHIEKQGIENQHVENPIQLNTNILSTNKQNTYNSTTKVVEEAEPQTTYGNENINRMYDLWEEMFGYRPKNSLDNRRAVYNMLRAKDKGEQWLVDTMRLLQGAQNDKYAGKDINGISNFKELSYNCEKVWKWGSSRARQVKSSIESIKI